jgi:hypothetical protein
MVGPSPIENGVQEKSRGPSSNFFFPKKFDDLFFVALDFFPTWNLFSAPSLSLLVNSTLGSAPSRVVVALSLLQCR